MRLSHALVVFTLPVLALVNGCGKSTPAASSATFAVKGYSTVPAGATSAPGHYHSRATTTSCDGGHTCCTAGTGCNPSMMNVTVYKVWLSTNASCASGVLVTDNGAAPTAQDVTQNPTLISGSPGAGTYQCMVLEISDTMQFKANQTAVTTLGGACSSTTTAYSFDVFRTGATLWNYDTGATEAGQGTSSAPVAQKMTLYVSTDPTKITDAVDQSQTATLAKAVTVTAGSTASLGMVLDFTDQVEDQTAQCWMAGVNIQFVSI